MHALILTYNDHTLFHMLRHFESIHEPALACLLNRGYRQPAIDAALKLPGSRFHSSFAQDLKILEQQMLLGSQQVISGKPGYQHWQISFDKQVFPKGIGRIGVVPISELDQLGAYDLSEKYNRGVLIQHAKVDQLPISWEMSVVVKLQKNYQLLITAFPGMPTMPLPQFQLETEFNKQCQYYWKEHCFLELNLF